MQTSSLLPKAGSSLLSQSRQSLKRQISLPASLTSTRSVSNSPYGRAHVWKRRPPVLPNPIVPKFPQKIIRSDGTSFIHWTTSPKSLVRLTRDTTNNPVWNTAVWASASALEEESGSAGRMGRFSRRFGGISMPADQTTSAAAQKSSAGKKEEVKVQKEEKETMVDMSSVGMGGVLDDVSWFEQMADLTGGDQAAPKTKSGKKK